MLDLAAEGNYVAVRPSGTEPLVKFYLFAYQPPQEQRRFGRRRAAGLPRNWQAVEADLRSLRRRESP